MEREAGGTLPHSGGECCTEPTNAYMSIINPMRVNQCLFCGLRQWFLFSLSVAITGVGHCKTQKSIFLNGKAKLDVYLTWIDKIQHKKNPLDVGTV